MWKRDALLKRVSLAFLQLSPKKGNITMHDLPFAHAHQLTDDKFEGCCKNCEHSEEIIKEHILKFYKKIHHYSSQDLKKLSVESLYNLYQVLDDIANLRAGDNLAKLVLADKEIEAVLPTIRYYYALFFDVHEEFFAKSLIQSTDPEKELYSFPLLDKYVELIKNQMNPINIQRRDKIAFLGCGAFPISAILTKKIYKVEVVGIDNNPQKIDIAKKCIQSLKIDGIEIIEGDERNIQDTGANIISIAALAEPKKRIFQNLYQQLKTNHDKITICCRTYTGLKALLYYPIKQEDMPGFVVKREIRPLKRANNTILFLELT